MMVEFLFSQNLYVIQLLFRGQIIVVQIKHHNMVHDNMVHLYAIIVLKKNYEFSFTMLKFFINNFIKKCCTSACWPGFKRFPHSSHLKHSGCQSYPNDCLRSARHILQ